MHKGSTHFKSMWSDIIVVTGLILFHINQNKFGHIVGGLLGTTQKLFGHISLFSTLLITNVWLTSLIIHVIIIALLKLKLINELGEWTMPNYAFHQHKKLD